MKARAEGVAGHLAGALRHSANLDWLRTLAVAAVVVDHTAETLGARWGWAAWSGVGEHGSGAAAHWGGAHAQWMALAGPLGMAGVMAFFVHTSLVLLYSLERMGRGEKRAVRFYVRRIFRIYPLAMVVIVAMVALRLPRMPGMAYVAVTRAQLASNLLLVQNLSRTPSVMGSLWSLPLEVQMYVLLPALYVVARMRAGAAYVAAMMAGVMVLGVAWGIPAGHFMSAVFVPCFLAGVLCYALRDKVRAVLPGWMWVPAVAAMMALYCVLNARYEGATARALTDWGLCLALGLAINASRDSEAVAANRVAERVALYSYGIYLLHVPVLWLVFTKMKMGAGVGVVAMVGLTVGAAVATFTAIERPCIELGRRLTAGGGRRGGEAEVMPAP